jgi:UDP:flavonoid glycosyltransferase YjiC (YdhE family)
VTELINHKWLFPQGKAAVIHGGIGTTAATLSKDPTHHRFHIC